MRNRTLMQITSIREEDNMKTMKKAISVLLLVCMVSALCSAGAYAADTDPYTLTFGSGDSMTLDLNPKANNSTGTIFNAQGTANGKTFNGPAVAADGWIWKSSNTDVATIDTNANVTAKGIGNTTCTLTADDKQATWTGTVNVTVKDSTLKSVSINEGTDENTLVLTATSNDGKAAETGSIAWTSSNTSVVSVTPSADGKTATITRAAATTAEQNAIVTAMVTDKYGDTKSDIYKVTIPAAPPVSVDNIAISADTDKIIVGNGSVKLNVTITPDNAANKLYTWQVTGSGNVTSDNVLHPADAKVGDIITVKAIAQDGNKESNPLTFTVVAATTSATSINITSSNGDTLIFGGNPSTTTLTATAEPAGSSIDKSTLKWSGSNEYADVNAQTGVVTARKSGGSVTVTATAKDALDPTKEVSGKYNITVKAVEPTGVTVSPKEVTMELGTPAAPSTKQLTATVTPTSAGNQTIVWSSSDNSIATVDPTTGLVTAIGKGTAVITATVKNTSLSDTCTVTVAEPAAYRVVITPNSMTLGHRDAGYFTAKIYQKDNNGNYSKDVSGIVNSLNWSFTGDVSNGIGITGNAYDAKNNYYTATVLGWFNRSYNVKASCNINGKDYSDNASVTVSYAPAIVSGQNAVYNGRDAMSFLVNDSYENFTKPLYVDGREVSEMYYSTSRYGSEGYLVVTLNQSFLNFLCQYYNNNGYHTISIGTKYGAAASYFRTWGTYSSFYGVKTGDDANLGLWAALLAVSAAGAGAAVVIYKRRKKNNG